MRQKDWNRYQEFKQMLEDALYDAMFDANIDPDEEMASSSHQFTVYTRKDLEDVKVVVDGVHYEWKAGENPDDYLVDYCESFQDAVTVAELFFDFRQ